MTLVVAYLCATMIIIWGLCFICELDPHIDAVEIRALTFKLIDAMQPQPPTLKEIANLGIISPYIEDAIVEIEWEIEDTQVSYNDNWIVEAFDVVKERPIFIISDTESQPLLLSPTQVPTVVDGRGIMSAAAKEGLLDREELVFHHGNWNNPLDQIEYGSDESVFFARRENNEFDFCDSSLRL
jgi:hypothetical protein